MIPLPEQHIKGMACLKAAADHIEKRRIELGTHQMVCGIAHMSDYLKSLQRAARGDMADVMEAEYRLDNRE